MCAGACVCVYVHACVCVCVCACVRARALKIVFLNTILNYTNTLRVIIITNDHSDLFTGFL